MNPKIETITLLYFDGCPSWKAALDNLGGVLNELGLTVEIELIKIESNDQAQEQKFLGSPSIRVNGVDLWPEDRQTYTMSCRVYQTPSGFSGVPTSEMIKARLQEVLARAE
jgi:hypothetical protein